MSDSRAFSDDLPDVEVMSEGWTVLLKSFDPYVSWNSKLHRSKNAAEKAAERINRGLRMALMSSFDKAYVVPAVRIKEKDGIVSIVNREYMVRTTADVYLERSTKDW